MNWKRLILIAIAVLLALLAYSFVPVKLDVSDTRKLDPGARAKSPAGMRIIAFDAGSMSSSAAFAFRGGSFDDERVFTMGGVIVQHPRGTLLFDTGFGRQAPQQVAALPWMMRSTAKYTYGTPIVDQLQEAGVAWRSLTGIVPTHVHWDHVSGVPDMPGVPVWVTKEERDFIRDGGLASELMRSLGDVKYRVYDFPNGAFMGFPQSYDVFGDGTVVLVHAGGHTPGSVIAFLTPPKGPRFALIGDIAWQREGVDRPAERPWLTRTLADFEPSTVSKTLVHLHRLQKRYRDLVIVPAHDAKRWEALPRSRY